jgi:putative copper export protein
MTAAAEPLIHWPQPLTELAGFLALFLTTGAVALRFAVLRPLRRSAEGDARAVAALAARHAARWALAGAVVLLVQIAFRLPQLAANRHTSVAALLAHDPATAVLAVSLIVTFIGFALVVAGISVGWTLAALGVLAGPLRALPFAQWTRLVNPVHVLAGGAWIGTLFLLLAAALPAAMAQPVERREALVARLIHAFSPLALASAGVLGVFGVITAWRHLKHWTALWSTPYGIALMVKLVVVAAVLALGAWNLRRIKPRLGAPGGAAALRVSARAEALAALLVLVITAVLVSLPSP